MATVRFSKELRDNITNRAKAMFRDRIDSAKELPDHWGRIIYEGIFASTMAKMDALPNGYFEKKDHIRFNEFNDFDGYSRHHLPLGSEYNFPATIPTGVAGVIENDSYYGVTLDRYDDRWAELFKEYKAYCEAIHKLESDRDKFVSGVEQVIEAYTTLSPALKAWPPLWDLIPGYVRDKHREVKERVSSKQKATELAEDIDLNGMTGAVTASKLQGGTE